MTNTLSYQSFYQTPEGYYVIFECEETGAEVEEFIENDRILVFLNESEELTHQWMFMLCPFDGGYNFVFFGNKELENILLELA